MSGFGENTFSRSVSIGRVWSVVLQMNGCKEKLPIKPSQLALAFAIWLVCFGFFLPVSAVENTEGQASRILQFSEPQLADRYDSLIDELRCPKCQNQNLADSDAPIAKDLRGELHRLLEEGRSNNEILDFMTLRYGEFVRYRPELTVYTIALWALPLGVLFSGLVIWVLRTRLSRQKVLVTETAIPPPEASSGTAESGDDKAARQAKVAELLKRVSDD